MRIPKSLVAAVLAVLLAACGGGADAATARVAQAPASAGEVRALVQQFGLGGGDKDIAGDAFYDLGPRAAPGLLQVARDPATDEYELESIMFIASLYVREPEIFQALRTRAQAIADPAERQLRLNLIAAMSAGPGLPYPR